MGINLPSKLFPLLRKRRLRRQRKENRKDSQFGKKFEEFAWADRQSDLLQKGGGTQEIGTEPS